MMLSRESLKQQIDRLSDNQLSQIAEYISGLQITSASQIKTRPFWQTATPQERAQDFSHWVSSLPKTGLTLPDEAFDRADIYD